MKIFITGATGFIGKHLVKKLIDEKNQITINLYEKEYSPFDKNISTYKLNENNIEDDISFFKKERFDGVIHLASLFLVNHKPSQAIKLIDSNVRFSTHVLECCAQAKTKWFINVGSFWQHFKNKDYSPVNLYAASKQAFESIAQFYWETDQIKFCTLKLSDTYGPNDSRPKIFNIWKDILKSGDKLNMSPGYQYIDITHVYDIALAFTLLSNQMQNKNSKIKNGSIYTVKAKKRYTIIELAQIFENVTGGKLNINWGGREYRDREVMEPWNKGTIVPGWSPTITIEEGIKTIL